MLDELVVREHDACALVAAARKDGRATRAVLELALHGLDCLAHRSGTVDGEGDGSGVLTDLPRALWAEHLDAAGAPGALAQDPRFAVGHFFLTPAREADQRLLAKAILKRLGILVVAERVGATDGTVLGPRARAEEPRFWQVALLTAKPGRAGDRALHSAFVDVERAGITVVSLSRYSVVYKLRGVATQLPRYFPDLANAAFATSMAFGHNRYATNTTTSFDRVQPFASFAHNGEINTITRLRDEAASLGLALSRAGSDSQDVDAVMRGMVWRLGLTPIEAVELVFPPIVNEVTRMGVDLQDAYVQARAAFGPFAQGPAGILARLGDTCVFGVDALGLRPLWHVDTDELHVFASERGFVPLAEYARDPRPLAPGERVALERTPGGWRLMEQEDMRARFLADRRARGAVSAGLRERAATGGPTEAPVAAGATRGAKREPQRRWEIGTPLDEHEDVTVRREALFAALGYEPDDLKAAQFMAQTGGEPIGSLGYDGPLAALSQRRANFADYLQETVAVVTNPAIDREREIEHFSTRVVLGPKPAPQHGGAPRPGVELRHPILLGGHSPETGILGEDHRAGARALGTWIVEDVVAQFAITSARVPVILEADRDWEEHPLDALTRLGAAACRGVRGGARLVLVQDRHVFEEGRAWLDPLLVVAAAHRALAAQTSRSGSLRRDTALVVSAGSLRNLHDVVVALGLGADAVNPYLLAEYAISLGDPDGVANLVEALRKGIEKVISTLGVHELRGYGRQFAAIGVAPEVARVVGVRTFSASEGSGLDWERVAQDGFDRAAMLRQRAPARIEPAFRLSPRTWKAALQVANGEAPYATYGERLADLEREHPVAMRHLFDFQRNIGTSASESSAAEVGLADTSAGYHAAPFYISSMSFGSQGETAYRAYAEAAARLNILCINGEGGELPDLYGKYPRTRGQQIASGRFGVSAMLANSSDWLEIKIGQGAKPGEGGHLPGKKVSAKVALARNAKIGVDLISPSNNHDIYSIEDLAQVVHELHTVNPNAKVAVKIPVTPDVGIIAVGVAKAGADVVTLSGYDGGTGAARTHALRRAGLPAEIGVAEAHRALVASGLRHRVELWCDGGMRSAVDVAKMLCLGADRVGFGTLAMVAIGCTICRGCQLDTCHVGIATQMSSQEEATAKGVKRFEPREFERSVANLVRFFGAFRAELARVVAALGVASTAELTGRTDLLIQARGTDRVDLAWMLRPVEGWAGRTEREPVLAAVAVAHAETERLLGAADRFVGTPASGAMARTRILSSAGASRTGAPAPAPQYAESFNACYPPGSVAGNGFAAYAVDGVDVRVLGGAQDGAAKTALGGTVAVLKSRNKHGRWVDGSVGKCFAYGAQRGTFYVQGSADARAGIRLSGADVVFGGDLHGFGFEYMTGGRAVVLGDPGRWICAGQSGGMVFVRHAPERGLDEAELRSRIAKGAKVSVREPAAEEQATLRELLTGYAAALEQGGQPETGAEALALADLPGAFRVIRAAGDIVDQSVSTE